MCVPGFGPIATFACRCGQLIGASTSPTPWRSLSTKPGARLISAAALDAQLRPRWLCAFDAPCSCCRIFLTTRSGVDATSNRRRCCGRINPSPAACCRNCSRWSKYPRQLTSPTGLECNCSCSHVTISNISSNVPKPPGNTTKASARSAIVRLRVCIESTTMSSLSRWCATSGRIRCCGITPTTLPPAASAESASSPIMPTWPPPYTTLIPSRASNPPSSRAAAAYSGRWPLDEPQKTQIELSVLFIGSLFALAARITREQKFERCLGRELLREYRAHCVGDGHFDL